MALNKTDVCTSTRGFAGEIVIDISLRFETVSVVDEETAPEAAVMVVLPVTKLATTPILSMAAIVGLEELQRTDWVRSWMELSLKVPTAVNCFTAPAGIEELDGAIASETRVALVTVTEAVALIVPDVAVTVEVPGPTASPSPLGSTVSTLLALEDHCNDEST